VIVSTAVVPVVGRRSHRFSITLLFAAGVATGLSPSCKQRAPAPSAAPAGETARAPTAAPPASAPAPPVDPEAAAELIVGSERGLEAWRRDGSGKRLISKGPALHPRWLDPSTVVVVRADDSNLAKGGRLEKISLGDGKRTKVALLPPFKCATPPDANPDAAVEPDDSLGLEDESDFEIDRAAQRASLTIMDRNINMADIILDLRVDLTTGTVERWLSQGGDEHPCPPPPGINPGKPPDRTRAPPAPPKAPPPSGATFRFAFEQEAVVDVPAGRKAILHVPGYGTESTSPSERWAVLGGDVEEGDYVHRSLVLLDRTNGDLFPIRPKGGPWPAALPRPAAVAGKPAPKLKLPVPKTLNVVGETEIRWLGTTAASELLVIDALVVRPGAPSFSVKGRLAR
jgi:hypothetical protein